MKTQILLVAALTLGTTGQSHGGLLFEWKPEDGGNGHFYGTVGDTLAGPAAGLAWSWQEAKTIAEGMTHLGVAGHLATITSAEENQFIIDNVFSLNPHGSWIGLTDNEAFGGQESFSLPNPAVDGWIWVTGEPVSFTNWYPGEPNNLRDEDFTVMGNFRGDTSLWNDSQSGSGGHAQFLVEFDIAPNVVPEPSSLVCWTLIGLTMTGVPWWRRRHQFDDSGPRCDE